VKLLFDLQALQNESRTRGIGRYVRSLFDALARRDDIELYGLLNGAMRDTLGPAFDHVAGKIGAERVLVFPGLGETRLEVPDNLPRWRLSQAAYEAFVAESDCDALLVGSAVEGFIDGTSLSLKAPDAPYVKAVVLYDLIPLMDVERYLSWDKARAWYFDRIAHVEAADLALAISASSRSECLQFLDFAPDEVVAISTAMDDGIFKSKGPATQSLLARIGVTKPFVMHTSAIEPRKNFHGLIKAFAALSPAVRGNHQLVLVGSGSDAAINDLRALVRQMGLPSDSVVMPGFVADPDLAQLYRACRLFVFPSFHEGFGLPALEAMACGCATIGSNITSVPEVIGDPAYMFDPADTAAITSLMQRLLTDDAALHKAKSHAIKHAAKFSWDGVADRAVDCLKNGVAARVTTAPAAFPSARRMAAHVAGRVELNECPDDALEALARCLSAAEDELVAKLAAGLPKKGKTWRIEGPFDSSYSLALVNRETARAMAGLGWTVALHSTEGPGDFPANPDFLAANPDLAAMHDRAASSSHKRSFAVSRLLYPPRVADMAAPIKALHHYAWEESGFPQAWVDDFNASLTMLAALSNHVKKIMIDNGVSVPMAITGNGVDHWERVDPDPSYRIDARSFRFLHVSACFPRKGVDALLAAYEAAFTIDDDVSLIIKTFDNPHNDVRAMLRDMQDRNPRFPHVVTIFADLPETQLKAIYRQCHVLVGPSFAEGFGLPFAEAMLSGIPVITTNWGGQLDFCNPGNSWLVDYRFERARTHFGLWASVWARVDVPALAQAMREAHAASPETRAAMAARGREQLMARHKWKHVAQRLTTAAAKLPTAPRCDPRIGWISSWHSRCGIATYSQHLVDALPDKATVFSPLNETPLLGNDGSIRCWRQSKTDSELWRVLAHPEARKLDAFVIQFNYGFYNHADLGRFITQAKALDKSVIVCLHSTIDPPNELDVANFNLAWLAPALAACDRVLVHTIQDLNRLKGLGLVDNVALFPHGALRRAETALPRSMPEVPTIATYGFALPHKGLPEILNALRLLHDRRRPVKLRMVNAEYPVAFSTMLIEELKKQVRELGLTDHVEMHNRFLSDAESLDLLTDTDLVVFPYQSTAESASGAVRYGMAVERPVAVTPLPIFADLEGATFCMDGTRPEHLADGIAAALDAIAANSPEAAFISAQAERWREQHDYRVVGRRLFNMCKALVAQQSAQAQVY
jgi:glycosyltransferase involved in cell wall biosynthesis